MGIGYRYAPRDRTVYGIPLSPERATRDAQRKAGPQLLLLQVKTAQKILKTRLRAELGPDWINLQVDERGSSTPLVALLERVQRQSISAQHGVRFRGRAIALAEIRADRELGRPRGV